MTSGGPAGSGVKCQFPFIFRNVQYWGCPPDLSDQTKLWCSTKVDANGNHISGSNAYGFCSSSCPKHNSPSTCSNSGESCRPTIICSSQWVTPQDLERNACTQSDGSKGTCCQDITKIRSNQLHLGPALVPRTHDVSLLSKSVLTRAADMGQDFANKFLRVVVTL